MSEEGNPAGLSSCSGGLRPSSSCMWNPRVFADDARGWQCPFVLCLQPAGLCGRCTGVAVPLRVVPSATRETLVSLAFCRGP